MTTSTHHLKGAAVIGVFLCFAFAYLMSFGMRAVWCNRYGKRPERLPGKPERQIQSLSELPDLLGI